MSEEDRNAPSPGSTRRRQGWQISFARWLGTAARWATAEVDSMAAWTQHVVAGPPRRGQRRAVDPLGPLLERLAQLVAQHAADGPRSLARDPIFWVLIDRLHARRPRPVRARPQSRPAAAASVRPPEPAVSPASGVQEPEASATPDQVTGSEEPERLVEAPAVAAEDEAIESTPPTAPPIDTAAESSAVAGETTKLTVEPTSLDRNAERGEDA